MPLFNNHTSVMPEALNSQSLFHINSVPVLVSDLWYMQFSVLLTVFWFSSRNVLTTILGFPVGFFFF